MKTVSVTETSTAPRAAQYLAGTREVLGNLDTDLIDQIAEQIWRTYRNGRTVYLFGNGGSAGPLNTLFFSAGIQDEAHGLFGDSGPCGSAGACSGFISSGFCSFLGMSFFSAGRRTILRSGFCSSAVASGATVF